MQFVSPLHSVTNKVDQNGICAPALISQYVFLWANPYLACWWPIAYL